MTDFVGLTWDHPRGRLALEEAARRFSADDGDTLRWEVQPLEGFESAPIDELAARYDLLVLDHPHLGDALATSSLVPFDGLFSAAQVAQWRDGAVGPSIRSYTVDDTLWALPLDAATQVSARNPGLVPDAPADWDETLALASRGLVAPSLAGPHAFLTLCSIAVSLGDDPGRATARDGGVFGIAGRLFDGPVALEALEILAALAASAPAGTAELNPIGLLDRMRDVGDIGIVPLVYGYVTYSSPTVRFGAPPAATRIGSTIGGTGIAVTGRTAPTRALLEHLRWLLKSTTQVDFIPQHAGQPSARAAWTDPRVDQAAAGFYSATLTTIESSWVRPRFAGYIPFQSVASRIVRESLAAGVPATTILADVESAYRAAVTASATAARTEVTA